MKNALIIGLWAGLLLLPFKGFVSALIVFAGVFSFIMSYKPIMFKLKSWLNFYIGKWALPTIPPRYYIPLILAVLFMVPHTGSDYVTDVATLAGIYIILALGLNIVVGFTGLLNLGFVAFYAIGAYSYGLLNVKLGIGFWPSLPLALFTATFFGFILAVPALRLKGDYLAIVTLGFGEITRLVLNNWDSLTNGPNGLGGISPPYIGNTPVESQRSFYYFVLFFVIVSVFVIHRVYKSRTGRAWTAIREDETAAGAMGINTMTYKLYAVSFGAFFAGLAGALFAAKMRFISPESFTFMESIFILSMVILGGMGSIKGVIIGAIALVVLPEALRGIQMYRMLALSAGLVLLMIFKPQGLFGGKSVSSEN